MFFQFVGSLGFVGNTDFLLVIYLGLIVDILPSFFLAVALLLFCSSLLWSL